MVQEHAGEAAPTRPDPPRVTIRGLSVAYQVEGRLLPAVDGIDLTLEPGTITGLVGESGSGKSTLAMALLDAVQPPGRITSGSVVVDGMGDVLGMGAERLRQVRAAGIGYVFQAAQDSLNPLKKIGGQILDLGRSHHVRDLKGLLRYFSELLEGIGLPADRVVSAYQHELSGGMRQRVGIAFALALRPKVLVLDEPTTALDMITQATILDIIRRVHREQGLTTLLVTHDIGVVADVADRIAVLYGGRLVEVGDTVSLLRHPLHPYTRGLIDALPRLTGDIDAARPLPGRPPTLSTLPEHGCVFADRCPLYARDGDPRCREEEPHLSAMRDVPSLVACHFAGDGDFHPTSASDARRSVPAGAAGHGADGQGGIA